MQCVRCDIFSHVYSLLLGLTAPQVSYLEEVFLTIGLKDVNSSLYQTEERRSFQYKAASELENVSVVRAVTRQSCHIFVFLSNQGCPGKTTSVPSICITASLQCSAAVLSICSFSSLYWSVPVFTTCSAHSLQCSSILLCCKHAVMYCSPTFCMFLMYSCNIINCNTHTPRELIQSAKTLQCVTR